MAPARCSFLTFLFMHASPLGMENDDGPNDRRVTGRHSIGREAKGCMSKLFGSFFDRLHFKWPNTRGRSSRMR